MVLENKDYNYCGSIVVIDKLKDLEGLDRLKGFEILGFQALCNYPIGTIGVLFSAETELSGDFCHINNLYRHSELNKDKTKKGYLEDNRRIKAIKFKGNFSTALFIPLDSLQHFNYSFNVGDSFTHVNGIEVCKKYTIKQRASQTPGGKKQRKLRKSTIDLKLFPQHFDTLQLKRNEHVLNPEDRVIITVKLHGTSARFCHQPVKNLTFLERLNNKVNLKYDKLNDLKDRLILKVNKLWSKIYPETYTWKTLAGSRTTIKDTTAQQGFYKKDVWNDTLEEIKHLIPKNWVLYGEIIGWAGNSPIQSGYTYNLPQGKSEFFVYRISIVNNDGIEVDLSWEAIKAYCNKVGLRHVPEMYNMHYGNILIEEFMDKRYADLGYETPKVDAGKNDEGIVLRREGLQPLLLKAKCQSFLLHETKELDAGTVDLETSENLET